MKNIYVGNLDFHSTEEDLRTAFAVYGAVDRVAMMRDQETGQPRGFAFVEMTNGAEAEKAIAGLNGSSMGGRTIKVNEARPKPERNFSGRNSGASRSGRGGFGRY